MDIDQAGATVPGQESPAAGLPTNGKPSSTQGTLNTLSALNRSSGSGSGSGSSGSAAFSKSQPLAKSNSVVSHKSIPFTGAYPIGHLKVHQASSTPEPFISEGHAGAGAVKAAKPSGQANAHQKEESPPRMKGDAFILLSIPEDAHVGCDVMALTAKKTATADSSFLGFRELPPGAHFVWLSAPGAMSRQGYWFVTRQPVPASTSTPTSTSTYTPQGGVVRVKQWDHFNEVLGECASQYEARSLSEDLASVYSRLLAYNSSNSAAGGETTSTATSTASPAYFGPPLRDGELAVPEAGIWAGLTSCITEGLLARVTGQNASPFSQGTGAGGMSLVATGTAAAAATTTPTEWLVSTTDMAKGEMTMPLRSTTTQLWTSGGSAEFVFLFAKDDLDPYQLLASRDKAKQSSNYGQAASSSSSPPTATSQTAGSSDTTERIVALLKQQAVAYGLDDRDLVGELQFAFLTGTLLSNLSCLEQWWHIVLKVYLRAHKLVSRRPVLCRMLLQTLHYQFLYLERHVAGGFLGHTSSTGTVDAANKAAGASRVKTASAGGSTSVTAATEGDVGGTGLFEAKPQGALRLQASLTEFKRHLNETLLDLGKSASPDEAAAGEAFASLEASLWKYGWDLRSDYVSGGSGGYSNDAGDDNNNDQNDTRGGGFGDPADNNDADGEMDYYEEAINRTTGTRRKAHRHHTGLSDTDSDSDQPVLVELDEDGREVGLVSWD
ncbi:hypothetical protein SCUCBS95973_000864 [Sporothrix curviconia]|uniref:Uncharacterized protein n=1 Tax=Sporothrix curviconia TaxID=1260050 RepID=A0ABP0ATS4_9PEZI